MKDVSHANNFRTYNQQRMLNLIENNKKNFLFVHANFVQSDWLQERGALYDILTVVQNKPRSEHNFQTQNTTQKVKNPAYRY
jgi:hypothetical protein